MKDDTIDAIEVEMEEDCLKIMALHQPVAIDLRFLVAGLKINSDLERIADLSVNIAERALYLCRESSITTPFDFEEMTTKTSSMLKWALDSLIQQDPEIAHQVCADDDEVDQINRQTYNLFYDEIRKTPNLVESLGHCKENPTQSGQKTTEKAKSVEYWNRGWTTGSRCQTEAGLLFSIYRSCVMADEYV